MSKKPVPKKQQSNAQSSRRYKTFQNNTRKRLVAMTNVQKCPKCAGDKLSHSACSTCGYYKDRNVINKNKAMDKITRVKA